VTNPVKISFLIDTTDATAALGFEAWVDDKKFFDTDHVQIAQKISVEINDDPGDCKLQLIMKNKTQSHTQVNESGEIITDARLVVSDVEFEDIDLGHTFIELATYVHDLNGTAPETQDKFYGELGCNGVVELKFTTPIYLWLLEHM
jgi:hypothetical protein